MGKYTPGPWKHETVFDKIGNPCAYSVWPCNQSGVRNRICMTPDGTTCENLRNAQLISAAPDLYEALKIILEYPYGDASPLDDHLVMERARAAIRKAEGGGMTMDAKTARQERIMGIRRIVRQQKELIYAKRERKAAKHSQRYVTLREHGLCVRCKQPAQPGMTLCWSCQLYNNQRRSGARQAPRG